MLTAVKGAALGVILASPIGISTFSWSQACILSHLVAPPVQVHVIVNISLISTQVMRSYQHTRDSGRSQLLPSIGCATGQTAVTDGDPEGERLGALDGEVEGSPLATAVGDVVAAVGVELGVVDGALEGETLGAELGDSTTTGGKLGLLDGGPDGVPLGAKLGLEVSGSPIG
jgi:hypothetical protein